MKPNRYKLDFISPACLECGGQGRMTSGERLFPKDSSRHGKPFFACECGAWTSCHPGTAVPAGRPAGGRTRYLRGKAHEALDALWNREARGHGIKTGYARTRAYKWLARELGLAVKETHIGWMDAAQLEQVIALCVARNDSNTKRQHIIGSRI